MEVAGRLGRYHRKESEEVEQREGLCCWVDYGIGERVSWWIESRGVQVLITLDL